MTNLAGCRVLVVEDEILIALMVQTMLSDLGGEVMAVVHTPAEALSFIRANAGRLDAVTLDLNLGGESAQRVATELAMNGIPFVVITGYGDACVLAPFQDRPVLAKPFLAEQLAQAFRSLHLAKTSLSGA